MINVEGGKVECAVSYHAELKEASTTLSLAPTFSECKALGFLSGTVNPEGCRFLLHVSEPNAEDEYPATFDIACDAGKAIKVVTSGCRAEFKAQSTLLLAEITNDTKATPKKDITFKPAVGGLAYTVTEDGFLCPFNGTGAKTGGIYTGSAATLTGQSSGDPETKIAVEVGETEPVGSFKAAGYPTTIHGSAARGAHVINVEGGKVECAVSYHAELKEASTTLSLAPTFSECKALGFLSGTVNPEGCRFLLHVSEPNAEDEYPATFDIACDAGKAIKVVTSGCRAEFKAQSTLLLAEITNDTKATPKKDITFKPAVGGLAYTVTEDGFLCPFNGTGAKTGGIYTGSAATLTGQSSGDPETKIAVEVG